MPRLSIWIVVAALLVSCGSDDTNTNSETPNSTVDVGADAGPDAQVEPDAEVSAEGPSRFYIGASGAHLANDSVRMRVSVGAPVASQPVVLQTGDVRMKVGVGPVMKTGGRR